jgi:Zn-finger nucleic acid-binding protein
MKCPVCPDVTLVMMNRQGVEIDYCPSCRGVWLDRGELDKLIELAVSQVTVQSRPPDQSRPDFVDSDYGSRPTYGSHPSQGYQPKRRKSWLNDIFD